MMKGIINVRQEIWKDRASMIVNAIAMASSDVTVQCCHHLHFYVYGLIGSHGIIQKTTSLTVHSGNQAQDQQSA